MPEGPFERSFRSRKATRSARSGSTTCGSPPLPTPRPAHGSRSTSRDETGQWLPVPRRIRSWPESALDVSFLVAGAGGRARVRHCQERTVGVQKGGSARFFGVNLIAPTAFLEPEKADKLADRLARSGMNLVRLGDLDMPIGPSRSLFDDTRDDTKGLDPLSLAKLDHSSPR